MGGLLALSLAHTAGVVVNGDFEDPGGLEALLNPGSDYIVGWRTADDTVLYRADGEFDDPSGATEGNCVSLGPFWSAGAIEQTLTTAPDQLHALTFYLAADPWNGAAPARIEVSIGDSRTETFTSDPPTGDADAVGWVWHRLGFVADASGQTLLKFQNVGTDSAQDGIPLVDQVQVAPGLPVRIIDTTDPLRLVYRQSGLYEHTVQVWNPGPATVDAVWLEIHGVPSGVTVYDATGKTNQVPYIQFSRRLMPGDSVNLSVEFYSAQRTPPSGVTYTAYPIAAQPPPAADGPVLSIEQAFPWIEGRWIVEFSTEKGQVYFIQYSEDMTTWKTAVPEIVGTGGRLQWIDSGPPKTETRPGAVATRYYRLVVQP